MEVLLLKEGCVRCVEVEFRAVVEEVLVVLEVGVSREGRVGLGLPRRLLKRCILGILVGVGLGFWLGGMGVDIRA